MSRRDSAGQPCKTDTAQSIAALFHSLPIAANAIQEAVTENDLKIVGDAVGKSGLNPRSSELRHSRERVLCRASLPDGAHAGLRALWIRKSKEHDQSYRMAYCLTVRRRISRQGRAGSSSG